ncbi:5-formyltetrahydrofolate cyclo-ligase [Oligella urethralis]|uniref:5-formyltetrahydrofolate cyclo-ligase n=1 Tax=Oligella urethralis TaxID=90245 RepID=UPI000DF91E81|nr:5-formyltetrahydrofolate cyclo-ligase [Oligella urethralis]SUA57735.1 5-formyltetrahydrofolate cyclo-ligase family protein [Oligella urethralis]
MQQNNTNYYQSIRSKLLNQRMQLSEVAYQARSKALSEHFMGWLNSLEYETQAQHDFDALKILPARHKIRRQGLVIAAYWPFRQEPDIRALLDELYAMGHEIVLPKIVEKNAALQFFYWDPGAPLVPGHFGILEPEAKEIANTPDIVLLPMLGYGEQGERLGYGGGYYDRTIAAWEAQEQSPILLGAVWSDARLPGDYEALAHDKLLDGIVTERELRFF